MKPTRPLEYLLECFFLFPDHTNAITMQSTRETVRQKRILKRRNSRKKSLSPSDLLRSYKDAKLDPRTYSKRSLSEGSARHRKSNIRRTLTHPFTSADSEIESASLTSDVLKSIPLVPESDESNIPPTSSDRDTEDDGRMIPVVRAQPQRPRWDSGSEMDSLVSTVVRRASARRRRSPANPGLLDIATQIIQKGTLELICRVPYPKVTE